MRFDLNIDSSNAALQGEDGVVELRRMLEGTVGDIGYGRRGGWLRDENGNVVGQWSLLMDGE